MDTIELNKRIAQEVFDELKYRLESMGYLPDEYFLMDSHWENGRTIPKGANIFCTTDYGASEGVYLDVYLKWYEDQKPVTKSFITGKTLRENGNDLDRMFLISSAITKAFYGEMACYAHLEHRFISEQIVHQSSAERIAAAPSRLLEQFAMDNDFRILSELIDKGIHGGGSSSNTLHMLTYGGRNSWMAEELLEKRMWVELHDYSALHACVQNDAVDVAKLLLDNGMHFEEYRQWAELRGGGHEETVQALADHWQELKAQEQMEEAPAQGGMLFG